MSKDLPQTADAFVESVYEFNRIGSLPPPGDFNADRVGFYIGMQLEELAEVIKEVALGEVSPERREHMQMLANIMDNWGKEFKSHQHDGAVLRADREKLLDGAIDSAVVAIGCAMFQTPRFREAIGAVLAANMAKFPNGNVTRDPNGKIMKPAGWVEADLTPFVSHHGE